VASKVTDSDKGLAAAEVPGACMAWGRENYRRGEVGGRKERLGRDNLSHRNGGSAHVADGELVRRWITSSHRYVVVGHRKSKVASMIHGSVVDVGCVDGRRDSSPGKVTKVILITRRVALLSSANIHRQVGFIEFSTIDCIG